MKIEKMSLYELGKEYEKCAELQQSFIDKCKEDIERAKELGDRDAVLLLRDKLGKFYKIKREIEETASKLKTYYK